MNNAIPFPVQNGERLPDPEPQQERKEKIILHEKGMIDMPFLILTVLLVVIGLVMMFSASYASAYADPEVGNQSTYYLRKQGMFALAGLAIMLFVGLVVHYELWRVLARPILIFTMIFMVLTPLIGLIGGGARRWIVIFGVRFQPSELAKLAVIMNFAQLIARYKDKMKDWRNLKPFLLITGLICATLFWQSHLSGLIIVFILSAAMLFLGGVPVRYFVIGFGGLALVFAVFLVVRGYAMDRITAWLDPWSDAQGDGFQIIQSLYAIGSGGLMGLGLGRSRQKYSYLPEGQNDYIFSIVCEELGFVGAVVIILLFVLLILRGYWIAMHAKDRFGALMAAGISTLMALQVFLNIGVVSNFLPSTGISLPFFSYGGTAMLVNLFEMGLVLSVSRQSDNQLLV